MQKETGPGRPLRNRMLLLAGCVLVIVIADQLTKYLVVSRLSLFESVRVLGDLVRITFIYNENGAFGLAPQRLLPFVNRTVFYVFFTLVAGGIVLYLYIKTEDHEKWTRAALILIAGGAVGNFIDRVRYGKVVDFIDCDFPDFIMERFAIFNVADSCVTVGISILIVVTLVTRKSGTQNQPSDSGQ